MKRSAGILLYRRSGDRIEVLLVHPGGPFWRNKDAGAWSIPKGEVDEGEDHLAAALREFAEETGVALSGDFLPLGEVKQKGGKVVTAFAHCRDVDPAAIRSNVFEIEWPPRSGRKQTFAEIDKAEWFDTETARNKINAGQAVLIERLTGALRPKRPSLR
jgi:predicted NUDIX family NTP pyrophosphohydrolase